MTSTHSKTRIRLGNSDIALSRIRSGEPAAVHLLHRAKAEIGFARCLCTPTLPKLVIRSRAGRFHVARWPAGGDEHSPACRFHGSSPTGTDPGTAIAGIRDDGEGVSIRVDAVLRPAVTKPGTTVKRSASGQSPAVSRSRVSMLGMLQYWWQAAGLHRYRPGQRRTWGFVQQRLKPVVERCRLNGLAGTEVCHIAGAARSAATEPGFDTWQEGLRPRPGRGGRVGLLIGEVTGSRPTDYGVAWAVKGVRPRLFSTRELATKLERSFRLALAPPRAVVVQPVAVFTVSMTRHGNMSVQDAGVLATRCYVPVDSGHEIVMAEYLMTHEREFVKPIRMEPGEATLPDFVVTDTTPHTLIEVWGMTGNAAYDARKSVKVAHYRKQRMRLVEWTPPQPLPSIPEASLEPQW